MILIVGKVLLVDGHLLLRPVGQDGLAVGRAGRAVHARRLLRRRLLRHSAHRHRHHFAGRLKDEVATLKNYFLLVKRVPGRGPEQRDPNKAVLCLLIIIILISYIIIKLLIIENHPSQNRKQKFYQISCTFLANVAHF